MADILSIKSTIDDVKTFLQEEHKGITHIFEKNTHTIYVYKKKTFIDICIDIFVTSISEEDKDYINSFASEHSFSYVYIKIPTGSKLLRNCPNLKYYCQNADKEYYVNNVGYRSLYRIVNNCTIKSLAVLVLIEPDGTKYMVFVPPTANTKYTSFIGHKIRGDDKIHEDLNQTYLESAQKGVFDNTGLDIPENNFTLVGNLTRKSNLLDLVGIPHECHIYSCVFKIKNNITQELRNRCIIVKMSDLYKYKSMKELSSSDTISDSSPIWYEKILEKVTSIGNGRYVCNFDSELTKKSKLKLDCKLLSAQINKK